MADAAQDIRILIADSHGMFCEVLQHLLEEEPDFRIVGAAVTGREVLEQAAKLSPDVLLLGLPLWRPCGMAVLGRLACLPLPTRSILMADAVERFQLIEALKLGARGMVPKCVDAALLFKCIRAVMAGEYWIGRKGIADLVECFRAAVLAEQQQKRAHDYCLTRRETEIILSIVDGCTNRDIAEKLAISEQTVKHHMTKIFGKVGVANRRELALFALQKNFAPHH